MQMVAGGTKSPYLPPVKSDGTLPTTQDNEQTLHSGVTLLAGATYYFPAPALKACAKSSWHVEWDNAIVLTSCQLEQSNFPESSVVADYAASAAGWAPLVNATAVLAETTAGGSVTANVLSTTGGTAGDAVFTVVRHHAARVRMKVVVGATGGVLKMAAFGKDG